VCGIKVHWHDGRVTREVAEVARRRVVEISKVHALKLPPSDAALVLGGNILRLTRSNRR
jgi:hypothetical protein